MYPDNNQNVSPSDYLNQIAPQQQRNKFDLLSQKPSHVVLMALGLVSVIILIASIIGLMSGNGNDIEHLAARLTSTQSTAASATENIKSPQLRALNSSLQLYLTNTIRDATPIFVRNGVKMDSLSNSVKSAESNTKMLAVLEDARLNAIYDRTYAREMAYQLDTLITLMRKVYNNTSSKSLKNFLSTAYKSLEPTQKQFADYFAANS
jgi:hypothetical protein